MLHSVRIKVHLIVGTHIFFLVHSNQISSGAHLAFYQLGTGDYFHRGKEVGT